MAITHKPNFRAINDGLVEWVCRLTGLSNRSVIWANQQIERPSKPYVTLNFLTPMIPTGIDSFVDVCDDSDPSNERIVRHRIGPRQMTLSVNSFSDDIHPDSNAQTILRKLSDSIYTLKSQDLLKKINASILTQNPMQNLDSQDGSRWEYRAQMDFVLGYTQITIESGILPVESVNVSGTIKAPSGEEDTFNQDIP